MGIGIVGIQTSQKKRQNGAPFASDAAENGLSVDTVTGRIVLGNDAGAVGNPAQLLNTREIFGNGFNIRQRDAANEFTNYNGGSLQIVQPNGQISLTPPVTALSSSGGAAVTLQLDDNTQTFDVELNGAGIGEYKGGGTVMGRFDPTNLLWQYGPTLAFNTAVVQINGPLTKRSFISGPSAGAVAIDRDLDTSKLYTNSGALTLTVPVMTGADLRLGFELRVAVLNAGGTTIQLDATQTGLFGGAATTAGGTYGSVTVGSTIKITLVNATTWVAESFTGVWVLT